MNKYTTNYPLAVLRTVWRKLARRKYETQPPKKLPDKMARPPFDVVHVRKV